MVVAWIFVLIGLDSWDMVASRSKRRKILGREGWVIVKAEKSPVVVA